MPTTHSMPLIRENRLFVIDHKVLTLSHVRELAQIVLQEFQASDNRNADSWIKFSVKCFDYSSYESTDIALFSEESIINKKLVKSITIEYRESEDKYIKIRLNHGYVKVDDKPTTDSDVEIGGSNSFWVSGIEDKINTAIHSFPDQEVAVFKHKVKILWLIFLSGTYFFGIVIDFLNRNKADHFSFWRSAFSGTIEDAIGYVGAAIVLGGLPFLGFLNNMVEKSYDIWPPVELQIGPDHLQKEKGKRKYYTQLLLVIIVPFILSILSTIFTNLF